MITSAKRTLAFLNHPRFIPHGGLGKLIRRAYRSYIARLATL